jgi:hypothetical protein
LIEIVEYWSVVAQAGLSVLVEAAYHLEGVVEFDVIIEDDGSSEKGLRLRSRWMSVVAIRS